MAGDPAAMLAMKEYMERKEVVGLTSDIMRALALHKPDDPAAWLVQFLSTRANGSEADMSVLLQSPKKTDKPAADEKSSTTPPPPAKDASAPASSPAAAAKPSGPVSAGAGEPPVVVEDAAVVFAPPPEDKVEADTEFGEALTTDMLMKLLLPPNMLTLPTIGGDKFTLSYSRSAFAGWVKQHSPACAAASVAGAWNIVHQRGRDDSDALGQDEVVEVLRQIVQDKLDASIGSFQRLMGAPIDGLIDAARDRMKENERPMGMKGVSGAEAVRVVCQLATEAYVEVDGNMMAIPCPDKVWHVLPPEIRVLAAPQPAPMKHSPRSDGGAGGPTPPPGDEAGAVEGKEDPTEASTPAPLVVDDSPPIWVYSGEAFDRMRDLLAADDLMKRRKAAAKAAASTPTSADGKQADDDDDVNDNDDEAADEEEGGEPADADDVELASGKTDDEGDGEGESKGDRPPSSAASDVDDMEGADSGLENETPVSVGGPSPSPPPLASDDESDSGAPPAGSLAAAAPPLRRRNKKGGIASRKKGGTKPRRSTTGSAGRKKSTKPPRGGGSKASGAGSGAGWRWRSALELIFSKIIGLAKLGRDRPSTAFFGNWGLLQAASWLDRQSQSADHVTASLFMGGKGSAKVAVKITATDSLKTQVEQWHKLHAAFCRKRTALVFHLKNHYALLFAMRDYEDEEGNRRRQILTTRRGQRPTTWIDWSECRELMLRWAGHKIMLFNLKPATAGK